ncbi:MAG: iron-sulfur cluster assembly scaffold protein [Betaproteobacteria bacterium]|nr:iron-sulfur cluster assembly scaffold protein [Betaproteobacteria bacterium]
MSDALYQQAINTLWGIKDLASAAHGAGRLVAPDGSALLDNPFCGDRVRIEITRHNGVITALAQETKGCLLCRASASLLGLHAVGRSAEEIVNVRQSLEDLLRHNAPAPQDWPEFSVFIPARPHASRHGCVLLPFEALTQALS